ITEANKVDFTVDANAASSGQRFRILLRRASAPVTGVEVPRNIKVFPNPVLKGGNMQLEFSNQESGNYQVTVYSITGAPVQKEVLRHKGGNQRHSLLLDPRLSSGSYWIEVKGESGTNKQIKLTIQ
ncbi:MAG: T9SS type A sorting domain-containing protein, partial [Bacteroidetes bacterium]|nr:T9SS type A sorting domain-containing protein [Bacteroidota bacterium]